MAYTLEESEIVARRLAKGLPFASLCDLMPKLIVTRFLVADDKSVPGAFRPNPTQFEYYPYDGIRPSGYLKLKEVEHNAPIHNAIALHAAVRELWVRIGDSVFDAATRERPIIGPLNSLYEAYDDLNLQMLWLKNLAIASERSQSDAEFSVQAKENISNFLKEWPRIRENICRKFEKAYTSFTELGIPVPEMVEENPYINHLKALDLFHRKMSEQVIGDELGGVLLKVANEKEIKDVMIRHRESSEQQIEMGIQIYEAFERPFPKLSLNTVSGRHSTGDKPGSKPIKLTNVNGLNLLGLWQNGNAGHGLLSRPQLGKMGISSPAATERFFEQTNLQVGRLFNNNSAVEGAWFAESNLASLLLEVESASTGHLVQVANIRK